jgi:hypothetical protein
MLILRTCLAALTTNKFEFNWFVVKPARAVELKVF